MKENNNKRFPSGTERSGIRASPFKENRHQQGGDGVKFGYTSEMLDFVVKYTQLEFAVNPRVQVVTKLSEYWK